MNRENQGNNNGSGGSFLSVLESHLRSGEANKVSKVNEANETGASGEGSGRIRESGDFLHTDILDIFFPDGDETPAETISIHDVALIIREAIELSGLRLKFDREDLRFLDLEFFSDGEGTFLVNPAVGEIRLIPSSGRRSEDYRWRFSSRRKHWEFVGSNTLSKTHT